MPARMMTFRPIFVVLLLIMLWSGVVSASEVPKSREILILHSYHPGFPPTDEIMKGMQETLGDSGDSINFHVEYLDTKRHPDPEYFTYVLDAILHYKLQNRFFDLVLVSNNEALNFVVEHKADLFPETPIVFSGVVQQIPDLFADGDIITGVTQHPDYADLLKTVVKLQPNTREVVVIGSNRDLSGKLEDKLFKDAAAGFAGQLRFSFWDDLPADELATNLRGLKKGQVVFINGPIVDDTGKLLSFTSKNKLLSENCPVATYSPWDICLGHGIIGGKLASPREQGQLAARLALQILAGHPPVKGYLLTPEPSKYVFDYQQLKKHDIPYSSLPDGYQLINSPLQITNLPPRLIWTIIGCFTGALFIILFLSNNIMQKRKAQTRLRDSEQRYKQLSQQFQIILDGIPDGLTLISHDMKVIWSNKGAGTSYFNKRLGSVPGEYCCKLLYNRTALCDNCPAIQAFKSGCAEEAIITTPDQRMLEVKAFPLRDDDDVVVNVIMLASDVTEKTRLTEEAIRTSRLASLGELAAGIAHEINNPNALIVLNAELVQKSCAAAAPILQEHYKHNGDFPLGVLNFSEMRHELPLLFEEMLESANRIKRIVNDLKDFSRNDTPLLDESVDMNEVAQAAVRLLGNSIKNSTDRFQTEYADSLPIVKGNFQRIEQVVINLIMNACQSLISKTNAVKVRTYYDSENNRNCLVVQDEGRGIDQEIMPYITDPFFTTKRESGGTGLGLSVTSRIVQDHGGILDFHSPLGRGTTVTLALPAVLAQEAV